MRIERSEDSEYVTYTVTGGTYAVWAVILLAAFGAGALAKLLWCAIS
jgi:hypothetical protein